MSTLPVQLAVNVNISLLASLAQRVNFGRGLIVGSTPNARGTLYGIYTTLDAVREDYGVTASEYLVAQKYFAQLPKPRDVMIATVDLGE